MDIEISTSDPDSVDPEEIAAAIEGAGYFVLRISVNEGERTWEAPGLFKAKPKSLGKATAGG
jgi:hypothetical protein